MYDNVVVYSNRIKLLEYILETAHDFIKKNSLSRDNFAFWVNRDLRSS